MPASTRRNRRPQDVATAPQTAVNTEEQEPTATPDQPEVTDTEQDAPAPEAPAQAETPDAETDASAPAPVTEDADAPVNADADAPPVQEADAAPAQDTEPVNAGTEEPAAPVQLDEPAGPPVTVSDAEVTDGNPATQEQDSPEEPPATEGTPEPEPGPDTFLVTALSLNPEMTLDQRAAAWTKSASLYREQFLSWLTSRPEDEPVLTDRFDLWISGANGRGVAAARSTLSIVQSLLGAGWYEGSTHDSVKGAADRRMHVFVVAPVRFIPQLQLLLAAFNSDAASAPGPLPLAEQAVRKAQLAAKKNGLWPAGANDYQFVNIPSRKAMELLGSKIAGALALPADDPRAEQIRFTLKKVTDDLQRNIALRPRVRPGNITGPTDAFAVKADPATTTAAQAAGVVSVDILAQLQSLSISA